MGYAKKRTVTTAPTANAGGGGVSPAQSEKTKSSSSGSIWNMQIGGAKQKTDMKRVEVLLFVSELARLTQSPVR